MKKFFKNKKGFTLAELLIVVAIIAVLVAISIPIFTSQLEKAREATDAANIRDYYAEISASLLTDTSFTDATSVSGHHDTITLTGAKTATYATTSGGFTVTVSGVKVNQTRQQWQMGALDIAGCTIADTLDMVGKTTIVYTFTTATAANGGNTYLSSVTFGPTSAA